jgi:hypothetical protein
LILRYQSFYAAIAASAPRIRSLFHTDEYIVAVILSESLGRWSLRMVWYVSACYFRSEVKYVCVRPSLSMMREKMENTLQAAQQASSMAGSIYVFCFFHDLSRG